MSEMQAAMGGESFAALFEESLQRSEMRAGEVITADEAAIGIVLGSLAGADEATQQAVGAIQAALQAYIQAKGI